jgi:hypothetical protein
VIADLVCAQRMRGSKRSSHASPSAPLACVTQRVAIPIALWDRVQIVTKNRDRDDPWRAQRIRARIGGVIAVIIVLGILITLILVTAGSTSSGGAGAMTVPSQTSASRA